jgi:hypothetical protein
MNVPAPRFGPDQRDPAQVAPAESYRRGDQVWVYRHDEWHTGVVDGASALAVIVTYQREGMRGTVVDTVPAVCLVSRRAPEHAGGDR